MSYDNLGLLQVSDCYIGQVPEVNTYCKKKGDGLPSIWLWDKDDKERFVASTKLKEIGSTNELLMRSNMNCVAEGNRPIK